MDEFNIALDWAGGTVKGLAERLDVSPAAVCKWRTKGIPPERCREIEEMSGGEVTRERLRPDIFGPIGTAA